MKSAARGGPPPPSYASALTALMLATLGASLPSPIPSEGGGRGREGGEGETDLMEAGEMRGWKLHQWDRQHGGKMSYCAQHKRV